MSTARVDWRSITGRWMLVAAVAVALALLAVGTTLGATLYPTPVAVAFLLALAHAAAIPLSLRRPRLAGTVAALAVTALALAQSQSTGVPWPWAVTTMVTQSIVVGLIGFQAHGRVGVLAWLGAVAGTVLVSIVFPRGTDAAAINIILAGTISAVALTGGIVAREWSSISGQLIREREVSAREHEQRVLAEEKTRIARELHDVVAHSMSIITVQATSAPYRHSGVSESVAQEFTEIADAARTAMRELRGVLSVLRQGDADALLAPQPTLADIPLLVDATARSGVKVSLDFDPALSKDTLPEGAGLAVYRAAQEALSNAIRHAPGASIRATCSLERDAVVLSVVNTAPLSPPLGSEGGHGLLGMRERLLGAGGTLDATPTPDGGFSVVARVPVRRAA